MVWSSLSGGRRFGSIKTRHMEVQNLAFLMFVTTTTKSVSHERLLQFEFLFGLHDSLHDGFGPGFLAGEMVDGLHHFCIGFPFVL